MVDAQLPLALAVAIRMSGRDVKHTLDLTLRNRTSDELIRDKVLEEERVLITKDKGFRASHILRGKPKRLVFIITGNIRNQQLVPLFIRNLPVIEAAFERGNLVTFGLNGVDVQA